MHLQAKDKAVAQAACPGGGTWSLEKSNPPQNCQLKILISSSKQ